jgi:ABC-type multidrug transport system fused ATPase/permease subunit
MTTDTALIEKREELKRRLAAGEYKTLVDMLLTGADHLVRKITRRTKPLPIWFITTTLSLMVTVIGLVFTYIAGDWSNLVKLGELIGLEHNLVVPWVISNYVFYIASLVVINQYIGRIFIFWRDDLLDFTESVASLEQFEDWLEKVCSWRWHFLTAIIGALLGGSYLAAILGARFGVFIGYGLTITCIVPGIFATALLYLFLMILLLSARLLRYDLKLFAADPSSSELISRLSGKLSLGSYLVAVFASITTLSAAPTGFLPTVGILLVLIYWLPIIAIFALNQTSLSSIIRRAKWKTLNEAQTKVEKIRVSRNFGNQETMDAIKRLMDYHDRVKATRDSLLDFRTYLSLFNSLLLPLLAFILGNLDLVLKLFARTP